MTTSRANLVLQDFGLDPRDWVSLGGAGGFSGARFWRGDAWGKPHCLRLWPTGHPSRLRLQFIHQVLELAQREGFPWLPCPVGHPRHGSIVETSEGFWQLEPWLVGNADFHRRPTEDKASQAMQALAKFHGSVQNWTQQVGTPTAVVERIERLEHLGQALPMLAMASPRPSPELEFASAVLPEYLGLAKSLLSDVKRQLAPLANCSAPLRPSIRDIWSDHVLYESDQFVGLIDFGAMRLDWQLTDVARLLGSLDEGAGRYWQIGLNAYCHSCEIECEATNAIVAALDAANVLLAPYHWLNWLLFESRQFESLDRVRERLEAAMHRLRRLGGADGVIFPSS